MTVLLKNKKTGTLEYRQVTGPSIVLKSNFVLKEHLKDWVKKMKKTKQWTKLPKQESNEILYLSPHQEGFGLFSASFLTDVSTVTQAKKFRRNSDSGIAVFREIYKRRAQIIIMRCTGRDVSITSQ